MASTNKTENYNLSQFGDSDKPTWRGDYSGDMSKIDAGILEAKTAAVTAQNTANTAQSTSSELSDAVDAAQSTGDAAQATATAAQTTANAALPTTTAQAQYLTQANAAGTYETSTSHSADMTSLRNDLLSKTAAASTYETQTAVQTAHTSLTNQINALTIPRIVKKTITGTTDSNGFFPTTISEEDYTVLGCDNIPLTIVFFNAGPSNTTDFIQVRLTNATMDKPKINTQFTTTLYLLDKKTGISEMQ